MRKMVFYDDADPSSGNATHVFIEGPEHCQEISQVQRISYNNADKMVFCFKDLRYELHGHSWTPLTFVYAHEISKYLDSSLLTVGLSSEEAESRLALYGNNEHGAHRQTLLRRVARHFIDPLFIYLLLCASANILEGLTHGIVLVGLTITSIMVRELIRSRAEQLTLSEGWQNSQVKVIRDGGVVDIERGNLAPGDLFFPSDCIPCDAILLKGEISVDEVALTGESFPSPKFNLTDLSRIHDKGHWIL
jgi:magnesium-transporting ATPase (P-type)